ncbi:hypothetical protein EON82_14705 [bacterium]|nr:MAG: hypothetical protein EON82_14705 [bacterium]
MQYMVTGVDGKEYGPTDIATLKTWAAENRLAPHTMLRDFTTGQQMTAGSLTELFPASAAPGVLPVGMPYPRDGYQAAPVSQDHGGGAFAWIIVRALLAVVLFFILKGLGLIIAAYTVASAVQLNGTGSKYGIPAIVISVLALVVVGIGWLLRLSGVGV